MIDPRQQVPLAPLTTLEVGGPAEHFAQATTAAEVVDALRWARDRNLPVTILGGGSNVVVSDDGVGGLVVALALRGIDLERADDRARLTAAAGEPWDDVVAAAVAGDVAGIECLWGPRARPRSRTSAPTARTSRS